MAHENSVTIERDGRWYNLGFAPGSIAAGGAVGATETGRVLTPIFPWERWWYPTQEMAVDAARRRSDAHDKIEEIIRRNLLRIFQRGRRHLAHGFGRLADWARLHPVSVTAIEREEVQQMRGAELEKAWRRLLQDYYTQQSRGRRRT